VRGLKAQPSKRLDASLGVVVVVVVVKKVVGSGGQRWVKSHRHIEGKVVLGFISFTLMKEVLFYFTFKCRAARKPGSSGSRRASAKTLRIVIIMVTIGGDR
jgi:hypothetical protein